MYCLICVLHVFLYLSLVHMRLHNGGKRFRNYFRETVKNLVFEQKNKEKRKKNSKHTCKKILVFIRFHCFAVFAIHPGS